MNPNTGGAPPDSNQWKRPDEILRLRKLKQKQKALQARIQRPSRACASGANSTVAEQVEPCVENQKRKNPFSKKESTAKKQKPLGPEEVNEDSIFKLLSETTSKQVPAIEAPVIENLPEPRFLIDHQQCLFQPQDPQEPVPKPSKWFPIHWSIKSRLRIVCKSVLPGNNLRTNQEASGLTSFVRCIGVKDSSAGLDISPGARFYQSTLYWQHPHLPWLKLFPRNSKGNNGMVLGEPERVALGKEWAISFRNLFQLVRARQCPYFYVCANSFTVLFRAAGIGGRVETHALLTPTSRGMRAALKQEDIEFVMPLKKGQDKPDLNRSAESGIGVHNGSFSNSSEGAMTASQVDNCSEKDDDDDDEDVEEEKWLESLGVEAEEIKKINYHQTRKQQNRECDEDYSELSTVLIEGIECQAFFNFLLNAKSTTTRVGRLAGVPPTLLAPTAFVGATLQTLTTRSSKIRMDGEDYHSTELQGVILPHVLPYLCDLLTEAKDNFSATLVSVPNTTAFCKVSQKLIDDADKENEATAIGDQVLWKENLSDSGISDYILETMCRASKDSVCDVERIVYNKEEGYTWS
ncbi:protein downstream neighbor of son homolog [Toxorhynchites rutilus septentrionalis]|uniref:protein downstream neighbor of son homolog n=1 Tax=Toxorhynchites rutilus septentrionalis TaxID=329112 RepID=UPI00247A3C6B|nr:protein downstream neighbor of son homolog [Toxorhynchites rutilus septentrionalis]XP_055625635.1 protein downstream neighbor of son homolog [Toxorhynchites rutilus septentrionalis]